MKNHSILAQNLAEESIVLLKNEGALLPLAKGTKAAFFGRAQLDAVCSGNGSGAARGAVCKNILEECEKRGILAEPGLKAYYQARFLEEAENKTEFRFEDIGKAINSGLMYEIFGKYQPPAEEYEIGEALLAEAARCTDTAILTLGRNAGGEECDRHLPGDYELTDAENSLVSQVCGQFQKVVLILNLNGLIDLSWTEHFSNIKSILFAGVLGQEGAAGLAELLVGNENPSGKLSFTIAKRYEDYPSAAHFTWNKDVEEEILTYESYGLSAAENGSVGYAKSPVTVYQEDLYLGYRYFDAFGVTPLYGFGHGLSYTDFSLECLYAEKRPEGVEVKVCVKNTGKAVGKEVAQLYVKKPGRAYRELKAFEKTGLLRPGEEEALSLLVPWREWAVYEEKKAAWVIPAGAYSIFVGTSLELAKEAATLRFAEELLWEQCQNRLGVKPCNRGKISFLEGPEAAQGQAQALQHETGGAEFQGQAQSGMVFGEGQAFCGPTVSVSASDVKFPDSRSYKNLRQCETLSGDCDAGMEPSLSGSDFQGAKSGADYAEERAFRRGNENRRKIVEKLSIEQLAALCVGYGPGTPFAAFSGGNDPETIFDEAGVPLTTNSHPTGYSGYVSPAIVRAGIHSVSYQDGPAGVGGIAWPSEMLLSCAFHKKLWYAFGDAVGAECEERQIDVWLAPAVNLQRNPLCGRNFEYFSEDPYLSGVCACETARGAQENHPVLVCPKHFAANEQETFRRGSEKKHYDAVDSILSERAARELYLKPFEMLVKEAGISCLMTSFNKINGAFAAANADLCTHILKEEWGYPGVVLTDWGDMDVVADGADAVAAGNDIVMPGGPPVIAQILAGFREGRVSRKNLEDAVARLLYLVEQTKRVPK